MTGSLSDVIQDVTDQRDEDSTFYCSDFYRGQQVAGTARVLKDAKWVVGTRPAISNHSLVKAVVEEVGDKNTLQDKIKKGLRMNISGDFCWTLDLWSERVL